MRRPPVLSLQGQLYSYALKELALSAGSHAAGTSLACWRAELVGRPPRNSTEKIRHMARATHLASLLPPLWHRRNRARENTSCVDCKRRPNQLQRAVCEASLCTWLK